MKCWTTNFSIYASERSLFIMNQLKSVYSIPFLDSYSHPIHTCLSMISSNGSESWRLVEFEAEDVERLVALGYEAVHVIPASCPMVVRVAVTGRLVPEVRIEHALTHPPETQQNKDCRIGSKKWLYWFLPSEENFLPPEVIFSVSGIFQRGQL